MICWALVVTIPMAKLNWALLRYLFMAPDSEFVSAPPHLLSSLQLRLMNRSVTAKLRAKVQSALPRFRSNTPDYQKARPHHLGHQPPPSYFAHTVQWDSNITNTQLVVSNILFVNLMPVVFFVIFDGFVLLPLVEQKRHNGEHISPFLGFIASQALIFILSLTSVHSSLHTS